MGMMSDMEHEDYGPKRRAAEKAIGQTRDFLAEQVQDPTNYLPAVGKLGKLAFGAAMALKGTDADATMFGGRFLPAAYIKQIEDALKAGTETAESIFKKTGYFKNPEGQWRKYVPDKDASVKSAGYLKNYYAAAPVKDSLIHPDLYRVDQGPGNVPVSRESMGPKEQGYYNPYTKKIGINANLDEKEYLKTLLHEVQHHIQNIGKFTMGGSPQQFKDWMTPKIQQAFESTKKLEEVFGQTYGMSYDDVSKLILNDWKAYRALPDELKKAWQEVNKVRVKTGQLQLSAPAQVRFKKYENIPGEVEARVASEGHNRNFMAEDKGLANLYDLYGKEISNTDFYPNFQFSFD